MTKENKTAVSFKEASNGPIPEKLEPAVVGVKSGRVAAPKIEINAPHRDERYAQTEALDREYPEYVHVYQPEDISSKALGAKGMEVVKGEDGTPLRHRADIVCRIAREKHEAPMKRDALLSRKQAKEVNGGVDRTKFADPKQPVDFGNDDIDRELNELNNM